MLSRQLNRNRAVLGGFRLELGRDGRKLSEDAVLAKYRAAMNVFNEKKKIIDAFKNEFKEVGNLMKSEKLNKERKKAILDEYEKKHGNAIPKSFSSDRLSMKLGLTERPKRKSRVVAVPEAVALPEAIVEKVAAEIVKSPEILAPEPTPKKKRGRPKKIAQAAPAAVVAKRARGRPKKSEKKSPSKVIDAVAQIIDEKVQALDQMVSNGAMSQSDAAVEVARIQEVVKNIDDRSDLIEIERENNVAAVDSLYVSGQIDENELNSLNDMIEKKTEEAIKEISINELDKIE